MLCREGNVSAISFLLGLAIEIAGISQGGRYLASLLSESLFSSIYSLFILYLVVLIALLSIALRSKDFQVIGKIQFYKLNYIIIILDCNTCRYFGIFIRCQLNSLLSIRREIQVIWNLWSIFNIVPLLRVLSYRYFKSSLTIFRIFHINTFNTIWNCCTHELD